MTVRRPTCPTCLRPQTACICAHVRPVETATEILILQHPLEEHQAKNSARLLHLCLGARSRIVVGEVFEAQELGRLLHDGAAPLLLYPAAADAAAPAVPAGPRRLVVLDATWRKSRKMLALNPLLGELPRLSLPDDGAALYAIRKSHAAHQRSTLEATARALLLLEPPGTHTVPLLDAMRGFVAQQQGYLPPA